jgi:replicative DNA helicase
MAKQTTGTRSGMQVFPDLGKVPPQAIDMEEAVLGAIMLEKEAVITILDILKPESFYKDANRKIFKAVSDLSAKEYPVDLTLLLKS